MAENFGFWPLGRLIDRFHPARRELEPLTGNGRALARPPGAICCSEWRSACSSRASTVRTIRPTASNHRETHMGNRTFVIGVGMTKFEKPGSRDWDYPDMAREAGTKALADAGISYDESSRRSSATATASRPRASARSTSSA